MRSCIISSVDPSKEHSDMAKTKATAPKKPTRVRDLPPKGAVKGGRTTVKDAHDRYAN